jgi:superfamily II DNA or RNA helicase
VSLAPRIASYFDPPIRERGAAYVAQGRVRIVHGSPTEVRARVRGTQDYAVTLAAVGSKIVAACDCPYAEDAFCKHLWAVVRASDRDGHLSEVTKRSANIALELIDGEDGDDDDLTARRAANDSPPPRSRAAASNAPRHSWQKVLLDATSSAQRFNMGSERWANRELSYVVQTLGTGLGAHVRIQVMERPAKGKWKPLLIAASAIAFLPREQDRMVLGWLANQPGHVTYTGYPSSYGYGSSYESVLSAKAELSLASAAPIVLEVLRTGRAFVESLPEEGSANATIPVLFEDGPAWEPLIEVDPGPKGDLELRGWLVRGDERIDVVTPELLVPGVVATRGRAARVKDGGTFGWVAALRSHGIIDVPERDIGLLLTELLSSPAPLRVEVSAELGFERTSPTPTLCAFFRSPRHTAADGGFRVDVKADYDGIQIPLARGASMAVDADRRRLIERDREAESKALDLLPQLGARPLPSYPPAKPGAEFRIGVRRFPAAVRALVAAGWHVEADGKPQRAATDFRIDVASGVDWFDLTLQADFGGVNPEMTALLAALRHGATTVALDDGSVGMIPEEWLRLWGVAVAAGTPVEGRLRFRRGQAALLDVLLAERPDVSCDRTFVALRHKLASFDRVEPLEPPPGFVGKLRDYQKEGLGWLAFLREVRLGGCLADDMGLGKTVQVLAMLLGRKRERERDRPSLVVVPRSLLFNWKNEASRFAPDLSMIEYFGGDRRGGKHLAKCDVVLTTYGTLRRDIHELSGVEFDYVILDEATAIKTSTSATAKAARLLRAEHRLGLTGTPIENHLGELWSLFEFLNPGMLGSATWFKQLTGAHQELDASQRVLISRAIRPFILRRTKAQVAKELPERVEQTLYCDLPRDDRSFYDQLRDHVRSSLKKRVERDGVARSTVHILEGLLRLRQAACHPALVDKDRPDGPSAKLDLLFEHLETVREEGEKAIVFSQFTSLLALVRKRLDAEGVRYEYLDGATRDRKKAVERFQNDRGCPLFLISLKAGGIGLNLTAAHYVFLLDPWWNPAVEAQAIDRAHRIGQHDTVFAYRIIARDTVEEKVAELQKRKRALADAVLGESPGNLRGLTRADLEVLLA